VNSLRENDCNDAHLPVDYPRPRLSGNFSLQLTLRSAHNLLPFIMNYDDELRICVKGLEDVHI